MTLCRDSHMVTLQGKLDLFLCFTLLQEKVKAVFDNLIQLEHLNIVKFHKYWADVKENKARVSGVAGWPAGRQRSASKQQRPLASANLLFSVSVCLSVR